MISKSLKAVAMASVLVAGLTPAVQAGGLADAIIESEVVEVEPAGSMAGWLVPLIIVGLIVLIAQGNDDPEIICKAALVC